jgi:hypothetical protein
LAAPHHEGLIAHRETRPHNKPAHRAETAIKTIVNPSK